MYENKFSSLTVEITVDELEGLAKELAETFGVEVAFKLSCKYGGKMKYFPKPDEFLKATIKAKVKEEYRKGNISKRRLAEKYNVPRSTISAWLN